MTNPENTSIVLASSQRDFDNAKMLFAEYASAIDFEAGFKDFQAELAFLETRYTAPNGCLLLAYKGNAAVGCIAVVSLQPGIAELKRFYVQPHFQQFKIGAKLLETAIINARHLNFNYLRLEVIPTLTKAKALYASFGFSQIEPYQPIELEGTAYMEKKLL